MQRAPTRSCALLVSVCVKTVVERVCCDKTCTHSEVTFPFVVPYDSHPIREDLCYPSHEEGGLVLNEQLQTKQAEDGSGCASTASLEGSRRELGPNFQHPTRFRRMLYSISVR